MTLWTSPVRNCTGNSSGSAGEQKARLDSQAAASMLTPEGTLSPVVQTEQKQQHTTTAHDREARTMPMKLLGEAEG